MLRAVIASAGLAVLAGPAGAQTYTSSGDFSGTANPAGVWTYGSKPAADPGATPLTVYPEANDFSNLRYWSPDG